MKTILIDPAADELAFKLGEIIPNLEVLAICSEGEKGWEAASVLKPEVCFLNLDLPDTSGLVLMQRLAKLPIALIVCSAWSTYAYEALQEGAKAYLLTPLEEEEVRQAFEGFK